MPSNDNVFFGSGFIIDGFFAPVSVIVTPPAIIDLGTVGAAKHALPFRALGGSTADLDLLHGVLGKEAAREDIQPIFAVMLRNGEIRAYGFEIPRQAILDIVHVAHATLLQVDDITIEGNPAGDNLFGYVGLTTRPISSVRLDNTTGDWTQLIDTELLLNAPAGLYVDIAHSVVMPVLTGTITGYVEDGSSVVLSYGQASRRAAPLD